MTDTLDLSPKREVARLFDGQEQRVVLARAFVQQPDVLLLDEPTSVLDIGHAQDVLELIDAMRTTRNLTVERVEKIYNAKVKTSGTSSYHGDEQHCSGIMNVHYS
ncbi:ATP-binding cassette domain-containing protein [Corynebacterium diphtheriae]|uniref:ATP-binding cassette domain-containing protein n=1 Tax=Corynebacterium diphtheriae TaxID=1717 RepID=UPI0013CA5CA0|nr:ATP-binding cassette domain-containing protein [Corynebacterium diphtheriae]